MTSMERRSYCTNRISKAGRIPDWFTKKLGRSNQSYGRSSRNDEKAV